MVAIIIDTRSLGGWPTKKEIGELVLSMGREHASLFELELTALLGECARVTAEAEAAIAKAAAADLVTVANLFATSNL